MLLCHLGGFCDHIMTVDGRTISSRLVHECNAFFLIGHLCRACFALLGVALGFSMVVL